MKTYTVPAVRWPVAQSILWRRVLFVDWHGVLSKAPLWYSIRTNSRHPFRPRLESKTTELFVQNWKTVDAWMKGEFSSEQVLDLLNIEQPASAKEDYFLRKLNDDCKAMPLHGPLIEALRHASTSWYVVIATDNMDCFVSIARKRRDIRSFADDIISSSDVGVLKAENPIEFFGEWLTRRGLSIEDAVLVDDGRENCAAFEGVGGKSRYVRSPDDATRAVWELVTPNH